MRFKVGDLVELAPPLEMWTKELSKIFPAKVEKVGFVSATVPVYYVVSNGGGYFYEHELNFAEEVIP